MARISETARLKMPGLPTDIDHQSPLEEQVAYVFTAMNLYAKANSWAVHELNGQPGRLGSVTMTYLVGQLFPEASKEERQLVQQIVSSVLRKSNAAVCVGNPSPAARERGAKPTWWVADTLPNVASAVVSHRHADRLSYVEDRLTPHEAGEDREPAPVNITQNTPEPLAAERDMLVNDAFVQEIFEQVATSPVPITIPELTTITNRPEWAVRHSLDRLTASQTVVWRVETRDEKRVRGGGQLPPARPARLYWSAPGPVPERTELPPGIEPLKSSAEHAKDRMIARAAEDETVYDFLGPGQRFRTSGRIADELGLDRERVKASLTRLIAAGRVRKNESSGQFFRTDGRRRRQSTVPEWVPPKPEETVQETEDATETVIRMLEEVLEFLGVERDGGNEERDRRIEELERTNQELTERLDKIQRAFG